VLSIVQITRGSDFTNIILLLYIFIYTILTKTRNILKCWYHKICKFIVTYFIPVSFTELLVSAPWRWQDNNAETCRNYVKYSRKVHRIVYLLVLNKFLTSIPFSLCSINLISQQHSFPPIPTNIIFKDLRNKSLSGWYSRNIYVQEP
jgi:hypothetical protein